jgi:Holliday junction resolvase RusA-like endonuclease
MSSRVQLTIRGAPRPCERARRGSNSKWYTPTATRDYEQRIGWAWRAAPHPSFGKQLLAVSARFHIERPPSHYGTNKQLRERHQHAIPPGDLDNYLKALLDGLQAAGAFHNDTQIVCLAGVHKHWTGRGQGRTELDIWPVPQRSAPQS